jgi:hypothetical protein
MHGNNNASPNQFIDSDSSIISALPFLFVWELPLVLCNSMLPKEALQPLT